MLGVKNSYEAVLVISTKLGEENVASTIQKFKELIEANGILDSVDEWGKRKLAYMINKEAEAYYVLFNFTSESEFPLEFERICKITDGILRSLVIKKEN